MNHYFCLWSDYIYYVQRSGVFYWKTAPRCGDPDPPVFPIWENVFGFKICSAVDALKIKLWLRQRAEMSLLGLICNWNLFFFFFLNIKSFPDLSRKFCVNFWYFLLLLFPHSLWRVSFCVWSCLDRSEAYVRIGYQLMHIQVDAVKGPVGVGFLSTSSLLSLMGRQQSSHLTFLFKLKERKDRKEQQHMHKNEPSCVVHFRCTTGRGPERPQIPGTLFSGPLQDDQHGCWLWRQHLPGGRTPARCSVMLWMASSPWPAVWTDPVGHHCSVCTPSAGSRNVCCHLL